MQDEARREQIAKYLDVGLITEVEPRADTSEQTQQIVHRLKSASDDVIGKLIIAGVTEYPVEHDGLEQACETCMYYAVHRHYCALPELDVPVWPHWSCRLWRI